MFTAEERVLGTERFVMVALVAVRFVKNPVTAFNNVAKKFVEVAFVKVLLLETKFAENKLVTVALVKTGLSVKM